jgi:glycosyltransferase 2 family protein
MTAIRSPWQALARYAGWALIAASAVFLLSIALRHWQTISTMALAPSQWLALAGLSLAYGVSLLLVAAGWHAVLGLAGAGSPARGHAMGAHTTSQLAKYVPGNVFHVVGRHMIHRKAGMSGRVLAKAALIETLLMLTAALAIAAACLLGARPGVLEGAIWLALAAMLVSSGGLLVAVWWISRGAISRLATALLCYLAFFAIMGAIVAAIAAILGGAFEPGAAGGGVAAWIAGFVTPGAPGGLGIREAAMVLLGSGGTPAATLVLTAALFRLVTFAGDLVCFALGLVLFRDGGSSLAQAA